jgi:hypothetical protein
LSLWNEFSNLRRDICVCWSFIHLNSICIHSFLQKDIFSLGWLTLFCSSRFPSFLYWFISWIKDLSCCLTLGRNCLHIFDFMISHLLFNFDLLNLDVLMTIFARCLDFLMHLFIFLNIIKLLNFDWNARASPALLPTLRSSQRILLGLLLMKRCTLILNQILISLLLVSGLIFLFASRRFFRLILGSGGLIGLSALRFNICLAWIAWCSRIIVRLLSFARWKLIFIFFTFIVVVLCILKSLLILLISGLD